MKAKEKLERIRERAERVLEGEHWWLAASELPDEVLEQVWDEDAAIRLSVETEEAAARWLLKVIGDG